MPARIELRSVNAVFARKGTFVTAYLGVDPASSDAPGRWLTLLESPAADEVTERDLVALGNELAVAPTGAWRRGWMAVACEGEVVFSSSLATAPPDSIVSGPLPDLTPYLMRALPNLRAVVVVRHADTLRFLRITPGGLEPILSRTGVAPTGEDPSVSEYLVTTVMGESPDVLIYVGDAQSCERAQRLHEDWPGQRELPLHLIRTDDPDPAFVLDQVEAQLRADIAPAVEQAYRAVSVRSAAAGPREVVEALRMAIASTVVVAPDGMLSGRCWIGPRPTEFGFSRADARRLGVEVIGEVPLGDALVRAAAATDTMLVVLGPDHRPPRGGVAAKLRD